jgi:hypothetical protein
MSETVDLKGGAAMAMKRKSVIGFGLIFLLLIVLVGTVLASEPVPQGAFATPTPHESGEIYYVVQEGESCVAIGLKLQMDWNEIRNLNGLDESCNLQPGQELLIGFGATQTPVPMDAPTSEVGGVTPTVETSMGEICVFLFNDINGDGVPGDGEYPIADGVVSVSDTENRISETKNTIWDETQICFTDLPTGEYNISVAAPQGYNPTSSENVPLVLAPGQTSKINFGAQESSVAPVETEVPGPGGTGGTGNILLGIFGILMVVGGIVLGVYFWLVRR